MMGAYFSGDSGFISGMLSKWLSLSYNFSFRPTAQGVFNTEVLEFAQYKVSQNIFRIWVKSQDSTRRDTGKALYR